MGDDDVREPGQPETRRKTDQEIFDEQIARASGKFIVQLGGLGILAALVLSTIALVVAANRSNTTVTVPAAPTGGQTTAAQAPQLTGDALGEQIFVSGTPGGAISCGSCHTMAAAGTSGTTGPNLDKELTSDPASATRESIVDPQQGDRARLPRQRDAVELRDRVDAATARRGRQLRLPQHQHQVQELQDSVALTMRNRAGRRDPAPERRAFRRFNRGTARLRSLIRSRPLAEHDDPGAHPELFERVLLLQLG